MLRGLTTSIPTYYEVLNYELNLEYVISYRFRCIYVFNAFFYSNQLASLELTCSYLLKWFQKRIRAQTDRLKKPFIIHSVKIVTTVL